MIWLEPLCIEYLIVIFQINSETNTIDELAFQSNDIDVKSDPNKVLNSSFDRTHCGSNLNAEHQRHLSECLLSNPENDRGGLFTEFKI